MRSNYTVFPTLTNQDDPHRDSEKIENMLKCIKSASASVVAQTALVVIACFIRQNFACYVEKWTSVPLFSKRKDWLNWNLILVRNKCCQTWILSRGSQETLVLKRRYHAVSQYPENREKPQHFPLLSRQLVYTLSFWGALLMKCTDPKALNRTSHKKWCFGEDLCQAR